MRAPAVRLNRPSRFYDRGRIIPPILHFNLSELGVNQTAFTDLIVSELATRPFDFYDVARAIEDVVRENMPTQALLHEAAWTALWETISADDFDSSALHAFWARRLALPLDTEKKITDHSFQKEGRMAISGKSS